MEECRELSQTILMEEDEYQRAIIAVNIID